MTWKPDIVIYHKSCADGFASAWACWRRWGSDGVEYIPMSYGDPLPDIAGKHVLMVDFSLKREAMIDASKIAKSIVVVDHHETAEAELREWVEGSPDGDSLDVVTDYVSDAEALGHSAIYGFFDMEKSGCRLAWEFCHHDKPIPRLLEHIEDRDLWRFNLPYTKEISAAIRSYDFDFAHFDSWAPTDCGSLIWAGGAILRAQDKIVSDLVSHAYMAEVAGFTVPVVNAPYMFASEVGHELLKKYPDAPFAATWTRSGHGKILWSLRSENGRQNVADVAKSKGGGGHRNASGFSEPVAVGTP